MGSRGNYASAVSSIGQRIKMIGVGDTHHKTNNLGPIMKMPGVESYSLNTVLINKYTERWYNPSQGLIQEHYRALKDNTKFKEIQAFICGFPSKMCQIWLPFDKVKKVIMTVHRYNMDVPCTEQGWNSWNQQLKELSKDPGNTIAAASRYDLEYMKYYTDLQIRMIPSFSGQFLSSSNDANNF